MEPYIELNGKEVTNPLQRGLLMLVAATARLFATALVIVIPVVVILIIVAGAAFLPLLFTIVAFVVVLTLPLVVIGDRILKATGRRGFICRDNNELTITIEREAFERIDEAG